MPRISLERPAGRCPARVQHRRGHRLARERLPDDAIVTNGAGNYAAWVHRFFRTAASAPSSRRPRARWATALPAAVAAKLCHPDRTVVAFAGDGCFLMNGQEFATAVQYGCRSSSSWSTTACTAPSACTRSASIRAAFRHRAQEPRLRRLARAYGGHGETVETTARFAPALRARARSRQARDPDCLFDPEAITPTTTLSEIRKKASARAG